MNQLHQRPNTHPQRKITKRPTTHVFSHELPWKWKQKLPSLPKYRSHTTHRCLWELFFLACSSKCGWSSGLSVLRPFHFSWYTFSPMGMLPIDVPSFLPICWELTSFSPGKTSLWAAHLYIQMPPGAPSYPPNTWISTCPKRNSPYPPQTCSFSWIPHLWGGPIQVPERKPGRLLKPPHLGVNLVTSTTLFSSSLILFLCYFWSLSRYLLSF